MLPYAFVLALFICMGKSGIPNNFSSEAAGLMLLKSHVKPPWDRETKDCYNGHDPLTKNATMPIYGKKT